MPLTDNARGAAYMSAAMAGFVVNDAIMKLLLVDLPLGQTMAMRGLVVVVMIGTVAAWQRALFVPVPRADRGLLALRLCGEAGATVCYLTALMSLPLANATAILQAMPLAVTLAAAVFLREPVGWRRWLAILAGFAGVLMIARPGPEGFDMAALWALAAVGFLTLRDIVTRKLSAALPSAFVTTCTALTIGVIGVGIMLDAPLAPVTAWQAGLILTTAPCLLIGYFYSVMTMRVGDVGFIAPFRYTILVWSILLGIVVFGDLPDGWTLAGAALVVGAGLFSFHRERMLARRTNANRHGVIRER